MRDHISDLNLNPEIATKVLALLGISELSIASNSDASMFRDIVLYFQRTGDEYTLARFGTKNIENKISVLHEFINLLNTKNAVSDNISKLQSEKEKADVTGDSNKIVMQDSPVESRLGDLYNFKIESLNSELQQINKIIDNYD